MLRFLFLALVFVSTGCAAPRAQKMSFAEVFGSRAEPPTPAPTRKPRPTPASPASSTDSLELVSELTRFAHFARQQRRLAPRGSRMPLAQQENWDRLLASVGRLLARPVEQTSPRDVIRARAAAEAELDLDAQAYGDLPPELAQRVLDQVTGLAVRMSALRRREAKAAPAELAFDWPIDPVIVTSAFGKRLHPIARTWRSHYGVDLDAYTGQVVVSAARGTVLSAAWNGAHGLQVEIHHADGVLTRYSHLSATLVEPGTVVDRGDPIGLAGSTGQSTGSHLHFEVWRGGSPRDPLEELADHPAREARAGRVPQS